MTIKEIHFSVKPEPHVGGTARVCIEVRSEERVLRCEQVTVPLDLAWFAEDAFRDVAGRAIDLVCAELFPVERGQQEE